MLFSFRYSQTLSFALILCACSCIGLPKYSGYVQNAVQRLSTEEFNPDTNVQFVGPPLIDKRPPSKTIQVRSVFVPAIVVWYAESSFKTQLDSGFVTNLMERRLLDQVEKQGIRTALGENKLILEVRNLPDAFAFTRQSTSVWALMFVLTNQSETLYPSEKNPELFYKLVADTTVRASGKVRTINSNASPIQQYPGKTQAFLNEFIDGYQTNLDLMAYELVKNLKKQLGVVLSIPD